MRIEHHEREAVDVLTCIGRRAGTVEADELRDRIDHLVRLGEPILVLDLTGIETMDTSFTEEVFACSKRVSAASGLVKLVVEPKQRALFSRGRRQKFELYDVEDDAIDSFDAQTMTAGIP